MSYQDDYVTEGDPIEQRRPPPLECDICGSKDQVVVDTLRSEHGFESRYLCDKCDEVRDQEQPDEPPDCPMCDGHGEAMGGLGFLTWFRCRFCGIEWSQDNRKEGAA